MKVVDPLRVRDVSFSYRRGILALRKVSLTLRPAEIVGLVGANGSGKSTLIKTIFDLVQTASGSIEIGGFGHRLAAAKQQGLLLPSEDYLPEFLAGSEYLAHLHQLYELPLVDTDIAELFDRFSMPGRENDLIEDYSHGMRKKVQLIAAFMLRRPFTAIDETLNGIDFDGLRVSERHVRQMRDDGLTVLLCSHDFSLLERSADRIILMAAGEILGSFDTATILAEHGSLYSFVDQELPIGEPA
ncbi:ATP-binding cassette domain-containing protein [Micromonospora endophytica]|uniref:ATP-binding cassette domain-containing protein n=1 Tax=Micromonospora endophytica TaxID=515350 RepID=UPI0015E88233|nr:ABC transporter ATP-binding protein [Micromonospora endophytica]